LLRKMGSLHSASRKWPLPIFVKLSQKESVHPQWWPKWMVCLPSHAAMAKHQKSHCMHFMLHHAYLL
jgi:hypothetical protein